MWCDPWQWMGPISPSTFVNVADGVQISFPRIMGNSTLKVVFDSIALQYNTVFSGKVSDSSSPDNLPQLVVAGDIDTLTAGGDLSVTILVGKTCSTQWTWLLPLHRMEME